MALLRTYSLPTCRSAALFPAKEYVLPQDECINLDSLTTSAKGKITASCEFSTQSSSIKLFNKSNCQGEFRFLKGPIKKPEQEAVCNELGTFDDAEAVPPTVGPQSAQLLCLGF